jgi:hypothetical protein
VLERRQIPSEVIWVRGGCGRCQAEGAGRRRRRFRQMRPWAVASSRRVNGRGVGDAWRSRGLGMQGGVLGRRSWGCRATRGFRRRSRMGSASSHRAAALKWAGGAVSLEWTGGRRPATGAGVGDGRTAAAIGDWNLGVLGVW